MRTLRFHEYGEPADVLRLESAPIPTPAANRVRVAVHACGLNPADWALCRGLFPKDLPRGVGLDVSGTVDAVGEGVTGVAVGDRVAGSADFAGYPSAGASDFAILERWARVPASLDLVRAAALPMAIETAYRHLTLLHVKAGQTIVVNGGGTVIGFAAVQMALLRGARVIATAGETYAERLRAMGASVTSYGEGMAERIRKLAGGPVDLALDTAPHAADPEFLRKLMSGSLASSRDAGPVEGALPALIEAVGGDARRVVTLSDGKSAVKLGVRTGFDLVREAAQNPPPRHDALGEFIERAAAGTFTVPVARTFALEEWRAALDLSLGQRAHGKLVLLPGATAA
ncbi:MAG TPA: NADP-dependent oxidoreductase [Myxococcales bacterium]|nr:NADP-dependent oxidoreductase [Myxococcales bacterium]